MQWRQIPTIFARRKSLDRDRNYIHCLHYTMKGNYSFPFLLYFPELRRVVVGLNALEALNL
jgi:hypothetical protein